jgi:parallel beta-helix repeat protein
MRVKTTLVAAVLAGLTTMLLSGPAAADVIKVSPGESIQTAINAAVSGDTVKLAPGTYQENVQIKTAGITLKGAGPETVIEPAASAAPVDPGCEGTGSCVSDATDPTAPPSLADVRVKNLAVQGFPFSGVFFFATVNHRINDVLAQDSGYGIAAFNTTGGRYWDNVTPHNHEAGIYVGESENADATVRDNVANGNIGFGIFVRDATNGVIEDNETRDNCLGILFLDTPGPFSTGNWTARDNDASHNTAVCPAEEGDTGPTVGGVGIAIAGAHAITLVGNTANDNVPSGTVDISGGIVVVSIPGPTPEESFTATDNTIKFNKAFGNSPVDLFWDQQGTNTFTGNRCKTSDPDGLCAKRGDGNGHHGDHGNGNHGDHGDHGDDDHGNHGDHGDQGDHGDGDHHGGEGHQGDAHHGGKGKHGKHHKHHKHHKGKHHKGKHRHDD